MKIQEKKKVHIRWMLVCYDILIYLLSAMLLLRLYGGNDKLSYTGIFQQMCISMVCIFGIRLLGNIYGQVWRYGGIQCYMRLIFADGTAYDTWNMDPVALEKAFEIYPDTKVVVVAHLYGTPGKVDELNAVIKKHNAILVEDAAESMGATYKGVQTGTFGKYNTISFNGNKIITGSAGGCFLTDDEEAANKVRKWSTQARENAAWYQHEELGYNYRMSNVVAGVVRGQFPYLNEHIAQTEM